jgi:hypothetical protein
MLSPLTFAALHSALSTMSRRLATTYSLMIGQNDRMPPSAPQQPQPEDELKLSDFNFDGISNDPGFDEWNEAFIVKEDVNAVVTEEQANWGADEKF